MKKTTTIIAFAFLASCTMPEQINWQEEMKQCQDVAETYLEKATKHDVIKLNGPPEYPIQDDGAGGQIYTYASLIEVGPNGLVTTLFRSYYINSSDTVYHVRCFIR